MQIRTTPRPILPAVIADTSAADESDSSDDVMAMPEDRRGCLARRPAAETYNQDVRTNDQAIVGSPRSFDEAGTNAAVDTMAHLTARHPLRQQGVSG